jgi:hypothetical protein
MGDSYAPRVRKQRNELLQTLSRIETIVSILEPWLNFRKGAVY